MSLPFSSFAEFKYQAGLLAQHPARANLAVICGEHLWFNKVTFQWLCLSQLKRRISLGKHLGPISIKIKNAFHELFCQMPSK